MAELWQGAKVSVKNKKPSALYSVTGKFQTVFVTGFLYIAI